MSKNTGLLLLLFVVTSLPTNAFAQAKAAPEKPALKVQLLKAHLTGSKLKLDWKVVNNAETSVYVYATFLHGPGAGYEVGDGDVLVVDTSMMRKSSVGVNFYPKAEFLKLAPGKSVDGTLRDADVPDSVLKGKFKAAMLSVAYGPEIVRVQQALRAARSSDQHPANPIVEWQTNAHSNVVAMQ